MEDKNLEKRLTEIEIAIANQERMLDELNEVLIEQTKVIDKLTKQNLYLASLIENDGVKPLSEESPPPHY